MCHHLHVLILVLIRDILVFAAFTQFNFLILPKILPTLTECQAECLDTRILEAPFEGAILIIVIVLNIMVAQRQTQDDLVKGLHKVTIEKLLLIEGFTYYSTDEFE